MDDIRIEADEAKQLKDAVFVDARNAQAWAEAGTKLPGAVRVPADDLSGHMAELPRGKTIITYCT